MGKEIVFDGEKTLHELVLELKEKILQDDYIIGLCEIDNEFLLEITLMKREQLDS